MNEKALLLISNIEEALQTIEELYTALDRYELPAGYLSAEDEDELVLIAYRLHNLYRASENIFLSIARAFENQIDDKAGWHTQLLTRMKLDLQPLRPPVIDRSAFQALDELLRFRHLFPTHIPFIWIRTACGLSCTRPDGCARFIVHNWMHLSALCANSIHRKICQKGIELL